MKEITKNSRACGYLEKIYRELNADKFGGELEEPVITIQYTPRAYGHVTCSKVWRVKDNEKYELNIDSATIGAPIEEVVAVMLHEMVHIYHLMHGIRDCSRSNVYHNKKFKTKAEEVGLIVIHDSKIGWSVTSASDGLILYVADKGWNDILLSRSGINVTPPPTADSPDAESDTDSGQPEKKPSSTRKYICPGCGMSVRATRCVNIKCMDCDVQMTTDK